MHAPNRVRPAADQQGDASANKLALPFLEFVSLIALLMALTALSIDIMLPALPQIGAAFAVAEPNDRQAVVTTYLAGFAFGQLIYGPLSDRFGRKPMLMTGLGVFVIATLAALAATSFEWLLASRALQGIGTAAPRVTSVAIVRDLFSGRPMARVMSFVMTVFIIVPIIAPAIGQVLIEFGPWNWTFYFLLVVAFIATVWAGSRLPETRMGAADAGASPTGYLRAARDVLTNRQTLLYTIANGFMFGSLMSYIASSQQVFVDLYDLGGYFPVAFAAVASSMAAASFTNAQLVQRLGMRRLSHSALVAYIAICAVLLAIAAAGQPPLIVFCAGLVAAFFMFGLIVPNLNAIAMQPQGHIAGMASSIIGFIATGGSAALGWAVGRMFDGTVLPLTAGLLILGILASATVVAAEGPRGLFRGE